jgi:hypothetical protein
VTGVLSPWLRSAVGVYSRLDVGAERLRSAIGHVLGGLLGNALSQAEKSELTIHLYGVGTRPFARALTEWERAWYLRSLPPPPARVLLGAAGDGREAEWLCDAGYSVDALEPSPQLVESLRLRLRGRGRAIRSSYEDWIAATSDPGRAPCSSWLEEPYDAVILGWGSLTHVLDPRDHAPLLAICNTLAGAGPILASFWVRAEGEAPRSRASTIGSMVGQGIAGLRGLQVRVPMGEQFRTHSGFAYVFTRAEIEGLAAAVGRSVEWGEYGYPHVTLVKSPARG